MQQAGNVQRLSTRVGSVMGFVRVAGWRPAVPGQASLAAFGWAFCATLAAAAFALAFGHAHELALSPVAGVATGLLLAATEAQRRAVLLGMSPALLLGGLLGGQTVPLALVSAAGTLGEASLVVTLLVHLGRCRPTLDNQQTITYFVLSVASAAVLAGLLVAAALLPMRLPVPGPDWWKWALSHGLGMLTVTPALLRPLRMPRLVPGSGTAQIAAALACVAALGIVAGSLARSPSIAALLLLLLVPLIAWTVLRPTPGRVALVLLAIAAVMLRETTIPAGILADNGTMGQVLVGALAVGLLLGTGRGTPTGALPDQDSAGDLRAAAVAAPLLLFACAGWWDWRDVDLAAKARVERKANGLGEHAHRIFEVQEAMLDAALARVAGRSADTIAADPRVTAFLAQLVSTGSTSQSLAIVRLDSGRIVASSQVFPPPDIDHSDREYIDTHRRQTLRTVIGTIDRSIHSDSVGFTVSRLDASSGLVAVAHLPLEQFERFYATMREGERDVMNLVREDATLLARQVGQTVVTAGQRMPRQTISMRLLSGDLRGPVIARGALDPTPRLFHQSRVAQYPVHVVYGLEYAMVQALWLRQMLPTALLALLMSAMLHRLTLRLQRTAAEAEAARVEARLEARTQRSLAELNDQLRLAMKAAEAAAWHYDPVTDRGGWSRECFSLFGLDPADGVPSVKSWRDRVVHPEDRAMLERRIAEVLAGDAGSLQYDYRIVHPARGVRWISTHGLIERVAGRPIRVAGLSIDITDRKRAEERLRDSETRFRSLVNLMPAAMYTCDAAGRITFYNRQAVEIWGREPALDDDAEKYCGSMRLLDAGGEVVPREACPMARAVHTGAGCRNHEAAMERADGSRVPVLVNVDPLRNRDGTLIGAVNIFLDITDRKRAEEALRESEERLRLSTEAAGFGTFTIDVQAGLAHYSPELAAILGFPSARTVPLEAAFARIHRDDAPRIREQFTRALAPDGDGRLRMEMRFVRPRGIVRWMTWNGQVEFRDLPQGRTAVRVVGACADVTERNEAEEQLKASEARFRSLVSLSSDWYWEQDENFRFIDISNPVQQLAGSSVGSHIGKTRWELPAVGVTEAEWAAHRAKLERHEPIRNLEYRRINEEGKIIWMAVNGDPIFDAAGRFKGYRGTGHNITVRRQAAEALEASEKRMRIAARAARIGFWELSLDSNLVQGSPEFFELFELSADQGSVPAETLRARYHPDDRAILEAKLADPDTADGPFAHDRRILLQDGRVRWVHVASDIRRDADGRQIARYGATIDITERKQAEEELTVARRELERRVEERTADLKHEMQRREAAQASVSQLMRLEAVGRLAGGLAHDFNNGLAVISANLDLAEARISDPKARDEVQRALQAVRMSAAINRRLMAFTNRGHLAAERVDVNERLDDIIKLLDATLGGSIIVSRQLAPGIWPTRIDPGEFDSAILNLALNSRDAMPAGGQLAIETRQVTLTAAEIPVGNAVAPGDFVQVCVRDTGAGMSPEVLQRAGELFYTTKVRASNSGLGLSSVREFVRASGGFVSIDSVVGQGTTIKLYLPRLADEAANEGRGETRTQRVPLGDGELVLLVDDNEELLEGMQGVLESLGYAVVTASNGRQALELLEAGEPVELVLSDIVMPGKLSGYDVARRVLTERAGIRVVLASGFHSEQPPQDDPLLDGIRVLRKPFSREALAHVLHAELSAAPHVHA